MPDLLAPWIDQFNISSADTTTLLNNFFLAPGVGLQQMFANWADFTQDYLNDPASIGTSMVQMQYHLDAVWTGYALQNAATSTYNLVTEHTMNASHILMLSEIPGYLPSTIDPSQVTPILDFLASPASGILMGDIGPFISPWIALGNSITDGDSFNEIIANTTGAFFNGATLDLDSLVPVLNNAGFFPPGLSVSHLDFGFAGLLSTGSVAATPYDVDGTEIPAVGGSLFNSIGLVLNGVPVYGTLNLDSAPVGPLAAWESWGQIIGLLIGWDGSASPLATVDLPTIPADFFGDGAAAAAADLSSGLSTDLSSLVQDFLSLF